VVDVDCEGSGDGDLGDEMNQQSGLPGIDDFYVSFVKAQWRVLGDRPASALQPDSRDERVRLKPYRSE
jgi:hypothetical protein